MRCLMRFARQRAGVRALPAHPALQRSADLKARRIFACDDYSHSPCGDQPIRPFRQAAYGRGRQIDGAEDIAWGHARVDDRPRDTMRAWLASPGHRDAIVDPRWQHFSVAVRRGRLDGDVGVIWVAHFGRLR